MAISESARAGVRAVKDRVEDDLLKLPGVTGVDIDEKETDGRPTGAAAIVVYVARKRPASDIPSGELIPTQIDGVPTDVREMTIVPQGGPA